MKITVFYLILILSLSFVTGCTSTVQPTDLPVQHADPFYNFSDADYPLLHLPLIKPIVADCQDGKTPWRVFLPFGASVRVPNREGIFIYAYAIEQLAKFAVSNGVIMAYSSYVNTKADPYIQEHYYHWFVIIPDQEIAEGFQTEEEFLQHIDTLGIHDLDWLTPDDAYDTFELTGCLAWFPDCS